MFHKPKTPDERAVDAQVALALAIQQSSSTDDIDELLRAVVSTAELRVAESYGVCVSHGHRSLEERSPSQWEELRTAVHQAVKQGYGLEVIFRIIVATTVELPLCRAEIDLLLCEHEGVA